MAIGANSISENFNSLTIGNINGQGSYAHASAWNTAGTDANSEVVVFKPGTSSPRMVLRGLVIGETATCSIALDSGYRPLTGYVEFDYEHPSDIISSYMFLQSSASSSDSICGVGFDGDSGQIRSWDGASWTNLQHFNAGAGAWYTIKIVFDMKAGTAAIYVDSVLKRTETLVNSTGNLSHIYFHTIAHASSDVNQHIDNFVLAGDAGASLSSTVINSVSISESVVSVCDYTHTATDTVTATPGATHKVNYVYTATATVSITPLILDAKTLKTEYKYFLGTAGGTVHLHSQDYKGDAGVVIPCQYVTKDTDFSSQDMPSNDHWKTVYAVKVFYQDMAADTNIVVGISTNGGVTWPNSQSQTLGNGDKTRKDHTFFFMVTGQFFMFRLSSGSASTTFKFLGMEIEYEDAGPHWTIA